MKIIAVDLDGTLLNSNNEISIENIKAIKHAQKLGVEVVIATGRAYFDAKYICEKAGITTYIIDNNGSSIHTKEGRQIHSITMAKDDVEYITNILEENKFYYEVSTKNAIYAPHNWKEILDLEIDKLKSENPNLNTDKFEIEIKKYFSQLGHVFVKNHREILEKEEGYYNILAFSFDDLKRKNGINYFKNMKQLSLFSSSNYNFELVDVNASKGSALSYLASILNVSLDNTMAVGDNYNDISMFKKAGFSVAMGNANDDIKEMCKITTLSNDEDGVAHAIYKFMDLPAYSAI